MKKYIILGIIATLFFITAGAVTIRMTSDSDTQDGVTIRVSDVASDGVVVLVKFEVKYINGNQFEPGEVLDFANFSLTDENGVVLRENIGSNERYDGIRCKNDSPDPVDALTGSFTVLASEIADATRFKIACKDMFSFVDSYKEIGFSITDYLAQHPELNEQTPVYKQTSSTDIGAIYEEPQMEEKGLAIRFSDDTNFEIDNLCIRDGYLFVRINSDEATATTAQANLNIVAGGQTLYPAQDGTFGDKNYFCRLYPVTEEMIVGGITVQSMTYRSVRRRAEGSWSVNFTLEVSGQETPDLITQMPGTLKTYGQELQLARLAFTDYSVRISMNEVSAYQDVNEWGSEVMFIGKDCNYITFTSLLPMAEYSYDRYYVFTKGYSKDSLGAIVIYNAIRYSLGSFHILYNFDFQAGTCQMHTITIGVDEAKSYREMQDFIYNFYASGIDSGSQASSGTQTPPDVAGYAVALPQPLDTYAGDINGHHLFTKIDYKTKSTMIYLADFNQDMTLQVLGKEYESGILTVKINGSYIDLISQDNIRRINLDFSRAGVPNFPNDALRGSIQYDLTGDGSKIVYINTQNDAMLYDCTTNESKTLLKWEDLIQEDQLVFKDPVTQDYAALCNPHFVAGDTKIVLSYSDKLLIYTLSDGHISKIKTDAGLIKSSFANDKKIVWLGGEKNQIIYLLDFMSEALSQVDTGFSWGGYSREVDSRFEWTGKNYAVVQTYCSPGQAEKPSFYRIDLNSTTFNPVPLNLPGSTVNVQSVLDNGRVYYTADNATGTQTPYLTLQ